MTQTVRDSWLVFERHFKLLVRDPVWIVIGILNPLFYLLLFGPLLQSVATLRGFPPGGAYNVFLPGLLVQLGLFGTTGVGFGLISDLRSGVIERLRVTPVSRSALLLGRALRDMLILLLQAVILVLLALPFGLHIHPLGLLIMLGLLALIALLFASLSYALALWLRSEDSYAPLTFTVTLPLLLLSGVLLPLSLAPGWLRAMAAANPLSYAVEAGRAAFNDDLGSLAVLRGVLVLAVLGVIAFVVAARSFNRAIA